MGKIRTTTNDDSKKVFGLSAAANYLQCAEGTVLNHANAGRLACERDTSGKRLFTLAVLRKFKRSNQIGNRRIASEQRVH